MATMAATAPPLRGNDNGDGDEAVEVAHAVRDDELDDFSLSSGDEDGGGSESLDRAMMNELLLVCSNLGMLRVVNEGEAPVLMRGEDCAEWVHDLQRVIRRDHAKHKLVAKQLGKWKILQKKLLPLLVNHQHDWTLVFSILKVLVMLTMKPPRDSTNIAQQLTYLRDYKHAFLREGVVSILITILVEPLAKKGSSRSDQDYLSMELVLTLLRNLLAIPNEDARFVTSSSSHLSHLQQDLIRTLHEENVYEMVLLFAQDIDSAENREWNLLIMEMLDLTLGCSTPKAVAAFLKLQLGGGTSQEPQQQPTQTQHQTQNQAQSSARPVSHGGPSLLSALSSEKKLAKPRKPLGSQRHSNFGGMMKLVGSTGHSTVLTSFSKLGDGQVPQAVKKPVARKRGGRGSSQPSITQTMDVIEIFAPKQSVTESDHVTMAILVELCDTVLDKSYFQLTNSLKGEFRRGSSKLVSTDRLQYFHLIWFITTYHRLKIQALKSIHRHNLKAYEKEKQALMAALDFDTPPPNEPVMPDLNEKAVLSTLDMFSFNFVLQSIETYATGKNYHGVTVSVKLLAEMMTYLSELANSDDVRFQRIADSLQHKIFYERDFLDRMPVLLKTWSPGAFSMDYVVDVITLTHIVFKILDSQGTIKVLSRRKAHMAEMRKQKKKKTGDGAEGADGDDDGNDDDSGDEEEAERRAQLLLEMQRKEADFDVRRYFQSILSFETIKMYCHALAHYRTNSAKVNHYIHSFFYRAKHFRIHKDDEWTLQPMLFNIHVLLLFNKMLQDPLMQKHEYKGFLDFIRGVVRDFFTLADKNRLMFVETLLRQPYAAKSCLLMQRNYEASDGLTRSRAEAVALGRKEKLDRISEARRQKKALDAEDLDGEAEFTFTLNPTDFQASSLVASGENGKGSRSASTAERMDDEDDEGEAEFDGGAIAPSPAASRPKRRTLAATERAKNWTKIEDRFLKKVYMQYRHLPSVYEVISYEDMFQDHDRTPEQIERRVKYLKLHRATHDSSDDEESADKGKDSNADEDGVAFDNDTTTEETRLPKGLSMDDDDDSLDEVAGARGASTSRLSRRRRLRRAAANDDEDSDDDLFSSGALISSRQAVEADTDATMANVSESSGGATMDDTLLFPDGTPTYLTYNAPPVAPQEDAGGDVAMSLSAPSPRGLGGEVRDDGHGGSTQLSEKHRKRPREEDADQDQDSDATGSVGSPSKKIAREEAVAEAEAAIQPLTEAMEETQVIDDVEQTELEAEL